MRFSLLTLLLVIFWLAAAGLVLYRWHPWVRATTFPNGEQILTEEEMGKRYPNWFKGAPFEEFKSPDGTRSMEPAHGGVPLYLLSDRRTDEFLCALPLSAGFVDDNHAVGVEFDLTAWTTKGEFVPGPYYFMHRRHPEWWWGHFYRPEVWVLIALTVSLVERIIRWIRRKRAGVAA